MLIVGGGNDASLNTVLHHSEVSEVVYVDISAVFVNQVKKAHKNHPHIQKVRFVVADFFNWPETSSCDHIIMPFFIDLFADEQVIQIFNKSAELLSPKGQLHVIDFNVTPSTEGVIKPVIKLLYAFFSLGTQQLRNYTPNYFSLNTTKLKPITRIDLLPYVIGLSFQSV